MAKTKKAKTKKAVKKSKKKQVADIEHVATKGLPMRQIKALAEKMNEVIDAVNERSK